MNTKDMLPFTRLQKAIKWTSDGEVDIDTNGIYLKFDNEGNVIDDENSITIPKEELVFLKEGISGNQEEIITKVKVFKLLHDVANQSGLYEKGIFGASFITVGTDRNKPSYGKSKEHLKLGSLNIPSEKYGIGVDTVSSFRQYFYFLRARSSDDIVPALTTDNKNSLKIVPSEVMHILEAPSNADVTFLTYFEANSQCLFIRFEYLLLFLVKKNDYLKQINIRQRNRFIKDKELEGANIDNKQDILNKIKEKHKDHIKFDLYVQEYQELWEKDENRHKWLDKIFASLEKEVGLKSSCASPDFPTTNELAKKIIGVLKSNYQREDSDINKRMYLARISKDHLFEGSEKNLNEFLVKLPDINLPDQAYLRLIVPSEDDKSVLNLAHMVFPVNYCPPRNVNSGREIPDVQTFSNYRENEDTLFMVVALMQDKIELSGLSLADDQSLLKAYSQLLGIFSLVSLELLTIPEIAKISDQTKKHSIKSAISAVMSRNGSHNIGSHVINRVVEAIDSLNVQAHAHLFRYLQQRLDFLAQISTEFAPWKSSHWFAKEIMRGFYVQEHLLNFIARSEEIKAYEIPGDDCPILRTILKVNGETLIIPETMKNGEKSSLDNDVMVAVPGGILGFHSIYTILENFIRNSAKHGYATHPARREIKPCITIELSDGPVDRSFEVGSYIMRLYDNWSHISTDSISNENENYDYNLLKNYDFDLSHYNLIWYDDIELGDVPQVCKSLLEYFKEENNWLVKNYFPVELIEKLQSPRNHEELKLSLLQAFNAFIWNNSNEPLEGIYNKNKEINLLISYNKTRSAYEKRRLNRLFLEEIFPRIRKAAPLGIDGRLKVGNKPLKESDFRSNLEIFSINSEPTDGSRHIIFIGVNDIENDIKYSELFKNPAVRIIENEYWKEMIDEILEKKMTENKHLVVNKIEGFLQKYYAPLHYKINAKLERALLNKDDGSLRKENWGMAEMKISASFLQGIDYRVLGVEGPNNLEIVKALPIENEYKNNNNSTTHRLGYEFRIAKPVDVVLVGMRIGFVEREDSLIKSGIIPHDSNNFHPIHSSQFLVIDGSKIYDKDNAKTEIMKFAHWLYNGLEDKYREDNKKKIDFLPGRIFFIVHDKDEKLINKIINDPFFSKRIVIINESEYKDIFIDKINYNIENNIANDCKEFKLWLYMKWLNHLARLRGLSQIDFLLNIEGNEENKPLQFQEELKKLFIMVLAKKIKLDNHNKNIETNLKKDERAIYIENFNIENPSSNHSDEWIAFEDDYVTKLRQVTDYLSGKYGIGENNHKFKTLPKEYLTFKESGPGENSNLNGLIRKIANNENEISNPESSVVYFRHGLKREIKENLLYYENLSANASHFSQIAYMGNSVSETKCRIIENGLIKIAIADERIIDSQKDKDKKSELRDAGIIFISQFCKIKLLPKPDEYIIDINNYGEIFKLKSNVDVLIVHQGILDKISDDVLNLIPHIKEENRIEKLAILLSTLKEQIPFIIITSGRGLPVNIPDGIKFIPFSQIEASLLVNPHSKYSLTQSIMSLRAHRSQEDDLKR